MQIELLDQKKNWKKGSLMYLEKYKDLPQTSTLPGHFCRLDTKQNSTDWQAFKTYIETHGPQFIKLLPK